MSAKISEAILTVLATLPVGAEMRFYWEDGQQFLNMRLPGQPEQIARLNRSPDGTGMLTPHQTH